MFEAAIHLHRNKADPSFKSGTITGFERRNYLDPRDGKTKLRTYFRLHESPKMEGTTTGPDQWLQSGIKWIP
jgi:hypothetical protein